MSEDEPEWLPTIEDDVGPKDQQARIIQSDAYPMRVLAGAGTGKTFTMVRKIEHLVEAEGVSPDRILALTFTNNAADSMQEKLHAKLGAAGYDVDAYTYHSICNDLLTDYAYEAGIDPDFDIAMEAEKYAIVLEVLDEIDYRSIKPNVYDPDSWGSGAASALSEFVGSMKRSGITPEEIDEFLGPAERLYEIAELPDRIEEHASDHLGGRSVSSVLDGIPEVRDAIEAERADLRDSGGVEESVADFLRRLEALCTALEDAFEAHEGGERDLPENAHKLPKYFLGGYSSGAPAGIPGALDMELTDHLRAFLDDCLDARDLVAGYAAYERELEERNLLDFDALVVETVDLLAGDAGEAISDRWDYVFCDEFQDTDRLQFELVTSLVSDDQLFVVGDDDQAIYEWRGANVANITTELDDVFGSALTDEPLEENFRSRQPILDLANAALELVDDRQTDKTLTRVERPEYDGETVATIDEAEDPDDRAAQLVTAVRNLLSGESERLDEAYDPGDIALLVRKNDHATPILEGFEDAGIPYQVAGDLSSESIGVGTVAAYLKALARPTEDDVSWNRVFTMRYRLHEADLRRINEHEESTLDGLLSTPIEEFDEQGRVSEAREDARALLERRDRVSLSRLYRELKEQTNIEWYLSEQERRDLAQLEDVVEQYGDDAVQPSLTPEFVESLAHYESLFSESGAAPTSQPELADDAVNVMTIHKSKGLDFPAVLLPRLTADEWSPGTRTYDALETALAEGADAAFAADFLARDAREQRRLLHVAMTRAEDVLVLQGSEEDDESDEGEDENATSRPIFECVEEIAPASIPWEPGRSHLPIWADLQTCLPPSAVDWTDSLAAEVVGEVGGSVTHGDDDLSISEARERVLSLATQTVDGSFNGTSDGASADSSLTVSELSGPVTASPSIQHSYTSLEAFDTCPRQHYLEYVVNAFPDYESSTDESWEGVSQRDVGLLFHDTAEIVTGQDDAGPETWYEVVERLAKQRRAQDALPAARECIDRYFELELSEWEVVDAERHFQLDVDGHDLVGFIDAVYRTSEDELLVVDYKATKRDRDIEEKNQLPMYLIACRELYDEPIERAGYAHVGELGPKLETRTFEESELEEVKTEVSKMMRNIHETTFSTYTEGEHCQWCAHRSLPCAPETLGGDGS